MREFFIGSTDPKQNEPYRFDSNYIKTTKYNALTFLPLSILFQFKRFANIYFLGVSVLSAIPSISPFNPLSSGVPFVFVLLCSVFRDGVEDFSRYKSDKETNRQKCFKISEDGEVKECYSSDILVGDIVWVGEDQMFSSDLMLIESSNEGMCFIQTSSLDGEKNLKKRLKPKDFSAPIPQGEAGASLGGKQLKAGKGGRYPYFKGQCECDVPNAELYEFSGNLKIDKKSYPLSANQLLLKGSVLKNTEWIVGFVVYTGKETKLMMNAKEGRNKQSKVEYKMNLLVLWILAIQIGFCLLVSFVGIHWYRNDSSDNTYLQLTDTLGTSFVQTFFRYFLLLNTLIPISLIVTIEVVKVVQAYFIQNDALMYSLERDRPAKVSSASLNEELGQIGYIFSDKTGTLTRNIMEFKLCHIGSALYGDTSILKNENATAEQKQKEILRYNKKQGTQYTFKNKQIEEVLYGMQAEESTACDFKVWSKSRKVCFRINHQQTLVIEFLKLLSAAHQCMPETKKAAGGGTEIFYQGPSPDEVTLVEFAQQHGFEFFFGNDNFAKVRRQKPAITSKSGAVSKWEKIKDIDFEVFRRMEFNSDRKRMSILCRDPDDGHFKLYVKGADSIIKERLDPEQLDQDLMDEIDDFLTSASVKGFRTLLMAMKVLDEQEVKEFLLNCETAERNLITKDKALQQIYSDFEKDLVLVGATCVEDRLQDNVPETIRDLQAAGIKIWMLTGDKLETAENIGYSTNLLSKKMEVTRVSNLADLKREFNDKKVQINDRKIRQQIPRGILVEATALKHILDDESQTIKRYFLKIAKTCEAVICCRVSPAQKAEVVKLIKDDDKNVVTLAIGDGANDVSMILEAHIGVGLYGNEGMRAVQSGDYALGEFQFLWRLILVHGRWAYLRNCDLILYFFYKNIVFTLPQVFYAFVAAYSGVTVYDDWYISFYNLFFTSLPLMIRALFDQDINHRKDGQEYKSYLPKLYYIGQRSVIFNGSAFLEWLLFGLFHSVVVFIIPLFIFQDCLMSQNAYNNDMWAFSVSSFTSVIFIVTFRLMMTSRYFTWLNLFCIFFLSLGIYFLYVWASNYTGFSATYQSIPMIFSSPHYYLTVFLCVMLCLLVDFLVMGWRFEINEGPQDYLRKLINFDKSIEEDSNKQDYFNTLYDTVKKKYIQVDFEREERLEEKRDLRTNKYKVDVEVKKASGAKKREARNEIELEFMQQEE
ncbi:hypothetical protein FGO68_gene4748 [Halteria grandinella]|uniref:Phospholipid-transporting ATPase n=1 Tax=Halteria grandinella TaxID=5974 RepID=A0A8J8P384_HALGN|nr:hypothetical protein FGO68_gene4748 [Halteria grandinella]